MTNNKYFNMGVKIAAKTAPESMQSSLHPGNAAEMLDTGVPASLVDYIFGGLAPSVRARAGRAQGIAESANIDPGLTVKYPFLTWLAGAAGGGASTAVGRLAKHPKLGLVGAIIANLIPIISRRGNIKDISNKLSGPEAPKTLQQIKPKGLASRALLPFTAPTARGHTDAYQALQTGKAPDWMGTFDFINNVTGALPPLNVAGDIASRLRTSSRI